MHDKYQIRLANQNDAATIAQHRVLMFREMGAVSDREIDSLMHSTALWVQQELAEKRYVGWLAEDQEQIVAGAGIHLRLLPPGPNCMNVGRWGHIVNVYTYPKHRRRGIARRLMAEAIRWCAAQALDHVTLTASDQGRSLYEKLGFVATAAMSLPRHCLKQHNIMSPDPRDPSL